MHNWRVVYKSCYLDDGGLLFPEKQSHEFLENAKRTMGSYMFANQYLNQVVPDEDQPFKREWFKYYGKLPINKKTFIFVDPAISQSDDADFTAVVIVDTDQEGQWYVRHAQRMKITPTQLIDHLFELHAMWTPQVIGIEDVAFQKVLLYIAAEEMKRRKQILPLKGVKPNNQRTKEDRIMTLVPRFEWNRVLLKQGLTDLELELLEFPRGRHDDLVDALAQVETLITYPQESRIDDQKPHSPHDPRYESWYIRQLAKRNREQD
jgi:predicted phage terminase large subunit-like protein